MKAENSFEIKRFDFDKSIINSFYNDESVSDLWPLVYILSDGKIKEAYVGETTDALARMSSHLNNPDKNKLTAIHLITSNKFNKSATLDIESNLIKYLSGDGQYKLLNGNLGLANHTYYQKKEIYWDIFKTIWSKLKSEGITNKTLEQINNSDLFKYSPYKTLSFEQKDGLRKIISGLLDNNFNNFVIQGGAGTGKTILAVFLFKLLNSEIDDFNFKEFGDEEKDFIDLVIQLKTVYPKPSMALVIPMASFRSTIKKVFKNIKGLNAKMVVGPSEIVNKKYDILVVDEAHRLRKRVNLGNYFGAFDIINQKLNFNKDKGNELDWILNQGKTNIFFYDENQSIKPSDVDTHDFDILKSKKRTLIETLTSQFRVGGGKDYVGYIHKLLACKLGKSDTVFNSKKYEFLLFDSLEKMIEAIKAKEEFGLSRLVAGFSWKWVSTKNKKQFDIVIDKVKLKWNSVKVDWVNSINSVNEVGCIHTTQGYDLNYTGIIFGNEISYDKIKNEIIIRKDYYFDNNGKNSIKDPEELKRYIINIYKTIMLRGIKGTYVFVCDKDLREYFAQHIPLAEIKTSLNFLPESLVKPYINSVPVYDISIAAGSFSEQQGVSHVRWIQLPEPYKASKDYFVCNVVGESMNKLIPNNSWCLFKKDPGGSREGKIVLVQHYNIQESDFGAGYTVKLYHSEKEVSEDGGWIHNNIILKPCSNNSTYKNIHLKNEDLNELKVLGIFVSVLN